MKNLKHLLMKKKRMKERIRMVKSSHELNEKEGKRIKTTELWVIVKMHVIKKYIFNKYKMYTFSIKTSKKMV